MFNTYMYMGCLMVTNSSNPIATLFSRKKTGIFENTKAIDVSNLIRKKGRFIDKGGG